MPRKPSEAKHYSVRLNPRTDENERRVIEIVEAYKEQGATFKDVVIPAILQMEGLPLIDRSSLGLQAIMRQMQGMLERFAQDIVEQMRAGGHTLPDDDTDYSAESGAPSAFAKRFANSFLERQQRVMGDED